VTRDRRRRKYGQPALPGRRRLSVVRKPQRCALGTNLGRLGGVVHL